MNTAFIFDFDGVLVDTMPAHFMCYQMACAEVGVEIEREQFYRQAGMTGIQQINYFASKSGKQVDARAVYERKRELYSDYVDLVTPIEGNCLLIKSLHRAKVRIAIASGSSKASMLPLTDKFGIPFDAMVGGDDVARGKPDPELFVRAAEALGAKPAECTVFEDSDVGVEAAARAGMAVFRYMAAGNACDERAHGGYYV